MIIADRKWCKKKPAPTVSDVLALLDLDLAAKPAPIQQVPHDLIMRGKALVEGVAVDLDGALPNDET